MTFHLTVRLSVCLSTRIRVFPMKGFMTFSVGDVYEYQWRNSRFS